MSITVFEQQDIEDAGIRDFEDAARNTPNFSVFDGAGSRYFYNYSIRGLGNNNFLARDAVSFYVDDVAYDYGGFIGMV
ncbi:MAG: Plug domain-containing protein [Cyanobacteria bacterium J06656_5]